MRRPICEDDLHAWVDGRLPPERRAEVDAWLAEDPARAERVAGWRDDLTRLHAAWDPILDEPVPTRLRAAVEDRPARRWRIAAAVGWLVLGSIVGALGGYRAALPETAHDGTRVVATSLPRAAAIAHAVYSPEVRHPVEVAAADEQHLVAWLTKRLGAPVRVPDLASNGYSLLGGRLLPAEHGPSAQFMYEDDGGRRLTLYLAVSDEDGATTAFRFAQENGIGVFYWVEGRFAYALSGSLARDALLPVATSVYHQLSP